MRTIIALLFLAATPPQAGAQSETTAAPAVTADAPPATAQPSVPRSPASASLAEPDYKVGPRDTISVAVVGHAEFAATAPVTTRGTIVLPILREVEVQGLTAEQIRAKLSALISDGFLREPSVLVDVVKFFNMRVWVFGHVANPGEIVLDGPTSILELLSRVGNLTGEAGSTLTIERRRGADDLRETRASGDDDTPRGDTETKTVDLKALLLDGDLRENIPVRNGDKVYVAPSSSKVYAFGEVARPGFYPYRQGLNLAELIELAGGFTEFASKKKVRIRRPSLPKPIEVNLKDYYKSGNLEENVPLQEGDIVIVNSSFFF